MGDKYYLPNPVCAVCPFVGDGCCDEESCRRLNGICSFSQLYSSTGQGYMAHRDPGLLGRPSAGASASSLTACLLHLRYLNPPIGVEGVV